MTITFFHTLLFAIWMAGIPVLRMYLSAKITAIFKDEKDKIKQAKWDMGTYYAIGFIILIYPMVMQWIFG